MQQYSELKVSLSQLEQHMQLYDGLSELMNGLSGSDIHPHAIDAVKLRQCGQLPLAPSTAGDDKQHWLALLSLAFVCAWIAGSLYLWLCLPEQNSWYTTCLCCSALVMEGSSAALYVL